MMSLRTRKRPGAMTPRRIKRKKAKWPITKTTKTITPREHEILKLICREMSPGQISERLKISEKTFFNHRTNILKKTRSKTNVGLVKYAIVNRVVTL